LYPKWAVSYIYYKTSEGLVIFLDCLTLENEGAVMLQDCGNHSPSDTMSLTQWCYVTSQKIWILRSSTDKTSCSKIHFHSLVPVHYNSDKDNSQSIISQGNFSTSAQYKLKITNKVSTQQGSLENINTDTLTTVRFKMT